MRGSGPPLVLRTSSSSRRSRSSATMRSRRSASSCCTSESDGFFGSFDIATESGLKLAEPQVLHLAPQETSLDLQALDSLHALEWKTVELSRIDEDTQGQPLAVLLDHVLVTGHCAPGHLCCGEAADPARQHIDGTAHVRILVQQGELL